MCFADKVSPRKVDTRNPNAIQQRSISQLHKTSYRKISQSLEAARSMSIVLRFLCNLRGISAVLLPKRLTNSLAMRHFKLPNSRLQGFARSAAIPLLVLITGCCHSITTGIENKTCHAMGQGMGFHHILVVKTGSCLPAI